MVLLHGLAPERWVSTVSFGSSIVHPRVVVVGRQSLTHWPTFWRTTGKISGKRSCLQEPPEGVALESPGKTCAPRTKQMAGIAVVLT